MIDRQPGLNGAQPEVSQSYRSPLLAGAAIKRQRVIISLIRWCLPLSLLVLVILYEGFEHLVSKNEPWSDPYFVSGIVIFAVLGPVALFGVITYIQRLIEAQWRAQALLDEFNRDLQHKVAERTAELEASNAELRQLDEMKSEFVALVSHELRAPLTTLHGGLELALQRPDHIPPEAKRTLEIMRNESERLNVFVQNILDLSRLDAGRLPIILGPVALRPMLERSVQVIVGGARPIDWDMPSEHLLPLADEVHLEEAIRAILSNAHKYSHSSSPIHIRIKVQNSHLELSIMDHGPGILPVVQERIFDRFYRGAGKGDVQDHSGWGLGLYLARRLIEAQGGLLKVSSPIWPEQSAPGSAFIFVLPLDVEGEANYVGNPAD